VVGTAQAVRDVGWPGLDVGGWLVTGAGGMLGQDMMAVLRDRGELVTGLGRRELDVTDGPAVEAAIRGLRPAVVVNCAAWTNVDLAETHEDQALRINGHGAATVAAACAATGARMVQVSTDYVFGGDGQGDGGGEDGGGGRRPYGEQDRPAPGTAYGRTKLAGEHAVLELLPDAGYAVRTAWLYGAHGKNFVTTMIELERRRPRVQVVDDQHGQPTWTVAVARQIAALLTARAPAGIYHATSAGQATWCALAREVFTLLGTDPARVEAVTSDTLSRPAKRPGYTVLGHDGWARAGLPPPAPWQAELRSAFPTLMAAVAEPST
jgi:dTDP-4-dehydrorhamnose reductase